MLSFESEVADARARGAITEAAAARAIAMERREVFSIHFELRLMSYIAVALLTTGVGIVIKNNLDRIGPVAIITAIALVAAGCYAMAIRTKLQGRTRSIVGDYVLLLGALLLSADIGYAESQFHFFGAHAAQQLLVIAVLHAIGAYLLDSRMLLSASLTALTAWMGAGLSLGSLIFAGDAGYRMRGLAAAAVIFAWRGADTLLDRMPQFRDVFDHFAANLAFVAAVAWCLEKPTYLRGALLLALLVAAAVAYGVRRRREAFVLYAVIYGVIGFDAVMAHVIDDLDILFFLWLLISTPMVIVALFMLHNRMKGWRE
jgi:hypothetical protein